MLKDIYSSFFVTTAVMFMVIRGLGEMIFGYTPVDIIHIGDFGFIISDEYSLYKFNPFLDYLLFGTVFSLIITYVFSQVIEPGKYLLFYIPSLFAFSMYAKTKNLIATFAFIAMFVIGITVIKILDKEGGKNISEEFLPVLGVSVIIGIYGHTASSFILFSIFAVIIIGAYILTRVLLRSFSFIFKN